MRNLLLALPLLLLPQFSYSQTSNLLPSGTENEEESNSQLIGNWTGELKVMEGNISRTVISLKGNYRKDGTIRFSKIRNMDSLSGDIFAVPENSKMGYTYRPTSSDAGVIEFKSKDGVVEKGEIKWVDEDHYIYTPTHSPNAPTLVGRKFHFSRN